MKYLVLTAFLASQLGFAASALAQQAPAANALSVMLGGIENGKPIAEKFAYCTPDKDKHTKDGGNISPAISWSGTPTGTKSYAIIVVDRDVPASFESANKEGQTIAADFARQDFYHWVLVDVPASITSLPEGKDSKGMTPGGKAPGKTDYGINGINDYAKVGMGQGGGYDGPCPPWNDLRLHHYHFMVYALDVPTLGLTGSFTGKQAEDAMATHILAKGEVVGTYTQNQELLSH